MPILAPVPAARRLRRWGFRAARAEETWGQETFRRGDDLVRVTAVPGHHSRSAAVQAFLPTVVGWVLELEHRGRHVHRLYVTGDTLMTDDLACIRDRFPSIDTMVIHLGGTRLLGMLLTMDDREGVSLARLMAPGVVVPIHYDDYRVFRSPIEDFEYRAARELPAQRILREAPGVVFDPTASIDV